MGNLFGGGNPLKDKKAPEPTPPPVSKVGEEQAQARQSEKRRNAVRRARNKTIFAGSNTASGQSVERKKTLG